MSESIRILLLACAVLAAGSAAGQVTLYDRESFHGRSMAAERAIENLESFGFNDRASSIVVRGGWWQLCDHARFRGRCVTVGPGEYASLNGIGLAKRVTSLRPRPDRYGRFDKRGGDARPGTDPPQQVPNSRYEQQ